MIYRSEFKNFNFKNLADVIRNFVSDDDYVNKQREVIVNKINEDSDNETEQPEDEEDDEDDEEDGDLMERELDAGETVFKQTDETSGENLLKNFYSFNNQGNEPILYRENSKNKLNNDILNESTLLNKPTTPLSLRNSQVIQSKNFEKSQSKMNSLSQSLNPSKKENLKTNLSFNRTKNGEKVGKKLAESKNKSNFPSITSNDIRSIDSYEPVNTKTQDSNEAFRNKPKIQRTPDQSISIRQKSILASSMQSNMSYVPKYSVSEPRPSSASSNKSKNSPSSSILNQN